MAIDAVWDDPTLRKQVGSGRRLATAILETSAWGEDETLEQPRGPQNVVLSILADGGDPRAEELLASRVEDEPWEAIQDIFLATQTFGTDHVRTAMIDALRARDDAEGDLGAAILAASKDPYPERDHDLEILRTVVGKPVAPNQRLIWSIACRSLGRMEDPAGMAVLADVIRRAADGDKQISPGDVAMAAIGEAAGGRWEALAAAKEVLKSDGMGPFFVEAYLQVLVHRWHLGDEEASKRLLAWWQQAPTGGPYAFRAKAVRALYLRDGMPAANGPLAEMEKDLATNPKDAVDRLLSGAIRLRRGDAAARDDIVKAMRDFAVERGPLMDPALGNPIFFHPLVQGCRILVLYDR
jgi:hypothetical protein